MILKFKAEDLVSIIIEEIRTSKTSVSIEYHKINALRNELRKKGISSDLGARELKTISNLFPKNIQIEATMVKVVKTESFVSIFESHASRFEQKDIALLKNIWEEIK